MAFPEDQVYGLLSKYAAKYKKDMKTKMYIKGVTSPGILKVAFDLGFSYVGGPIIDAPGQECFTVAPLPVQKIGL